MKRKAEDNYDRNTVNDLLRDDRGRNGAMNRSGYNLVQSDSRKTTGRLFVSPLRRLEQAGKLGWGNIQSLNQSTSDDISRRRIVKLKLPSELLQERSQVVEEGSPEKMEILDNSNILDSKQNLESTTINDQNITSTSFSIFNNTAASQTQAVPSSTTGFGLFNNTQKETQPVQPVQQTTSIFGSSLQAQKSEEKPAGLFQSQPASIFASQGGFLFTNQKTTTPITEVTEKPKEETEAPKAGGLFGNLSGITGNKPMSGLFNISSTIAAAPVIEKKDLIQEEPKAPAAEGLQLGTDKTKLFGTAIPSPSGSQSKSLFSSNIKTEGGLPKAGLFGNLMDNKTPASLFGGNAKITTPATEIVPEKAPQIQQAQEQEQEKPKGGLFGNLSAKTETAPLFGSQQQPKTEMVAETPAEKPKGGLFGNLTSASQPSTGGLFGSSLSSQPKPEATGGTAPSQPKTETTPSMTVESQTEKPKGGLFSGLTSSQLKTEATPSMTVEAEKPKGGLFSGMVSSQPKTETAPMTVETQVEKPKGGLFGSMLPKAEATTPTSVQSTAGGLFGNQPKPETAAEKPKGLFGGLTSSQPKTETTTSMTVEAEKPKGGLFGGLTSSQPKTETTPTPTPATGGLFGSQPKAETTPTPTPAPTQTQAEKPKGGLFSGMATSQPKTESPQRSIQPSALGSFGQASAATQPKKETASPPKPTSESAVKPEGTKPGLFSGLASSKPASFLGSVNQTIGKTEESKDQTQEGGKPGLFSNVLGNKPTEGGAKPGLFSGLAPKPFAGFGDQKETAAPSDKPSGLGVLGGIGGLGTLSAAKGGLFSGGASSGGSFASLFGSGPSKSSSLFNKPAGGNEAKEDEGSEDEDDEEGDDDPEREPSPEADVSKSRGNYQYQQDYEKVMSKKVNKFKPGQKNMLQEGEISLNKKNESYFIIYRNKAKLIQYQGQIIPQVLKTEFLNPRKDALSVVTFSEDKGEEGAEAEASKGKPKLSKDLLKVMFGVPEDCEQFKKELDKIAK